MDKGHKIQLFKMIFKKISSEKRQIISRETNIGQLGESMAVKFLKSKGFLIINRNVNFHNIGEIDVVAIKDRVLHFIEVKTSLGRDLSDELHSLSHFDLEKKEKLKKSMSAYLKINKVAVDQPRCLDLLGVSISRETYDARVFFQENIYFEYY